MRGIWLAVLLWALGTCAYAQAIQQSGTITPFHLGSWFSNGVLGDAGMPGSPFASALALYGGSTCPFSISSQTGPGVTTSGYSQVSICQTNSATTFYFQGLNGQSNPNVFFNINGVSYAFPGGYGNVSGPGSSVNGDVACWNGTSGALLSDCGTPSAIASTPYHIYTVSTLPACSSGNEGQRYGVSDALGPSYLSPAVGGGTVHAGVGCNGTTWVTGY